MNEQKLRCSFLTTGICIASIFSILFFFFLGIKSFYFSTPCFLNIFLTYISIRSLKKKLLLKKINLIIFGSVIKLILIALFFSFMVYISDRTILTVFLVSFGLLIAPMTIRVVSYYLSS